MSDPIGALKQELLAAAERQAHVPRPHPLRRQRVLLAAVTLPVAAAVALAFTAPWKSSPGFLERAEAALTPPAGSILHYRWENETPDDSGCASGPNEIWVDQTPPRAFRALLTLCGGRGVEVGGALDTKTILMFEPPDRLRVPDLWIDPGPDPAAGVREAIREGRAHDEGTTRLDGRTVERIRWECPAPPCSGPPSYSYVDSETFLPVQNVIPGGAVINGRRVDVVVRYPTFEYLPRTAANLALTDLRAQHPDATGS